MYFLIKYSRTIEARSIFGSDIVTYYYILEKAASKEEAIDNATEHLLKTFSNIYIERINEITKEYAKFYLKLGKTQVRSLELRREIMSK